MADLSISAAARRFEVSRRTIHRWIADHKLHKIAGKVLAFELESLIDEHHAGFRRGRRLGTRFVKTDPKLLPVRQDRMAFARAQSNLVPRLARNLAALTDTNFCWFMGQVAQQAKVRGVKPHPEMVAYVNSASRD